MDQERPKFGGEFKVEVTNFTWGPKLDMPVPGTGKTLGELIEEGTQEARRAARHQVDALLVAGWQFELPEIVNGWKKTETEPWQWYWRRPPRGRAKKGRLFRSTNQAYNALMREQGKEPEPEAP